MLPPGFFGGNKCRLFVDDKKIKPFIMSGRGRPKLATPLRGENKKERDKNRVWVGREKDRWDRVKVLEGVESDQGVAKLLLDR